ncbi:MAG TPA: sialate O-acetylesterase, partial [Sphingobacterium sp.]|nr:sialate O-acetylesterase [Sphingobacterium sp.]
MNYLFKIVLGMVGASLLYACAPGKLTSKKQDTDPGYHIYLLMGQSNMAGRGVLTEEYLNTQHPRVLMLDKAHQWVPARHPIHFDKPKVAGVGPGLSFAEEMATAYPRDTIALVPCAVGGTAISRWEPGAYDKATDTHPYDDALNRIRAAQKKGVIKGIIWMQ